MTQIQIRNHARLTGGKVNWQVGCSTCDGADIWSMFGFARVVHAKSWTDALWWANWHAAEHERTACQCCGHMPPVPGVKVLDSTSVKVGDRLFVRTADGWSEVDIPDRLPTSQGAAS